MRLYNTLTKRKEEFKPLKSGVVSLYTCGPTVYDHIHIGNLRAFIMADLLHRALKANDFRVKWVMNITDVDDKTIHRSLKDFPRLAPSQALAELTGTYERAFDQDTRDVGVDLSSTKLVRATESIELMQQLIREIDTAGFVYEADGSLYFDLQKYTEAGNRYGQLSRVDFKPKARIDHDEYEKQEARDFVLWKAVDAGEPDWDLDFRGENLPGRPGWHIECSAMSAKWLGQPFDIHTGGVDLIFPHHENEIAQSQAAAGKPLANYFVHNEHLLVDGAKMSKSKHNYYTLPDIKERGFDPLAFRLLILQAHYRSQQNFTWDALAGSAEFLNRLRAWSDLQFQGEAGHTDLKDFKAALADDLDTPRALAALASLIDQSVEGPVPSDIKAAVQEVDQALGLGLTEGQDIGSEVKKLIAAREAARKKQDFGLADQLRAKLQKQGIELDDTPHGTRWHRTSKPQGETL